MSVVDNSTPIEAHEAANGLVALNDMLASWKSRNADVTHVDYGDVSDTFETATLTAEYRDPVVYLLAEKMAPEYGVTLTLEAKLGAADAWRVIHANFMVVTEQVVDLGLQTMPSQQFGFNRSRFV